MATWTLIQSAGYAVLAILGILVYECEMDMNSDKVSYLWYLIYFRREVCGPVNWQILGLNIPNAFQPDWPEVTDVAYRANIIIIIYLSLSFAWMITSVGLILASLTSCVGRCYYYSSLISWSIIGILILLADCAGVGVFVYDLVHLTTFNNMLDFLQIGNAQEIIDLAGNFSAPVYLPSLLMMITAARAFVIWGFNIAIIVLVIRFGSRIGNNIPKSVQKNQSPRPYEYGRDVNRDSPYAQGNGMYPMSVATQNNNEQPYGLVHRHPPTAATTTANNNINYNNNNNNYGNNNNGYNHNQGNNENMPRIVPAAVMQSSPSQRNPNGYPQNDNRAYPVKRTTQPNNINQNSPRNSQNDSRAYPVKRTAQSDNMNQNSPSTPRSSAVQAGRVSSPDRRSKTPPETPPKPILKVKNSQIDQRLPDNSSDRSDRNSSQIPPDELRSQLPWSYTSNPEELSKPRRNFVALREDEDLPPVPVPDYTLHFPKNVRPGIDNK